MIPFPWFWIVVGVAIGLLVADGGLVLWSWLGKRKREGR